MAKRSDYIKLGLFVLTGAGLLIGGLVLLIGLELSEPKRVFFLRTTDSVHGLMPGVRVEVRGVEVGAVDEVTLFPEDDPNAVRVRLAIASSVPIYRGAHAYLEYEGVSGQRYVEIRDGHPSRGRLSRRSRIPLRPTSFDQITQQVEEITTRGSALIAATASVTKTLEGIASSVSAIEIRAVGGRVRRILGRTDRILAGVEQVLATNEGEVAETARRALGLAEQASGVLDEVQGLVAALSGTVKTNDHELRATMENLRRASRSFALLARHLRRNPSQILFSKPAEPRELP